jgi:exonuclease SbcC
VLTARALLSARDKDKAEQVAAAKNLLRHTSSLIRKADSAIQAGESRQAAGIRRSIEEKLLQMDSMPPFLTRELEALDEVLGKLLDWKHYAVEPKQQQLIDKMQQLTNSQENPEALATKIKRLQDEWKGLSKGSQDQALWESFHQLAQQAYEPCKLYFDAQAQIRRDNIEKRKILVDQLQAYNDSQQWDTADSVSINWSGLNTLIGTAIKEWRSYSPIERGPNQTIQSAFDRNLDLLRKQLNDYYQRNTVLKKQLIDKAQTLLEQEDNRKAIDEAKRLQADWKNFGPAARKDEQALWKAFRAACDAIFEKRQQLSTEFKAQLNANKDQAKALQLEVKALLALSGQALVDAKARVDECRQAFNELGQLPKAEASRLKQSFLNSVDEFSSKLSQQRIVAKEQIWIDLLEASNKVRLSQLAVAGPEQEQLRAAAKTFITNIKQWPKNGLAAIEAKVAAGPGDQGASENELALKTLCIRAEILVDKPSPAEDKSLRMDYQVKRLEKGLGQVISDKNVELNGLLMEWIAVAPVATELYQALFERFIDCRS